MIDIDGHTDVHGLMRANFFLDNRAGKGVKNYLLPPKV
jgi:hypothetical protein